MDDTREPTKESDFYLPTASCQMFQISCNPKRPLVLYTPNLSPTLPKRFANLHVCKGPFETSEQAQTFWLGQELMKLAEMPSIRSEFIELDCDPQRQKLAPYGVRRTLKRGWFLFMESLHLLGGFPPGANLPTKYYSPANPTVRTNGLTTGQEWVQMATRVVDHSKLARSCVVLNDQTPGLSEFKAVLMRFILGWPDLAPRNFMKVNVTSTVYVIDGDHFQPSTLHPIGKYISNTKSREAFLALTKLHAEYLIDWLTGVREALASTRAFELVAHDNLKTLFNRKDADFATGGDLLLALNRRCCFILYSLRYPKRFRYDFIDGLQYEERRQKKKNDSQRHVASERLSRFTRSYADFVHRLSESPLVTRATEEPIYMTSFLMTQDDLSKSMEDEDVNDSESQK